MWLERIKMLYYCGAFIPAIDAVLLVISPPPFLPGREWNLMALYAQESG